MEVYDRTEDFPPFDCTDCGGSRTWTAPVPVTHGDVVVAWAPGTKVCWDCWERAAG